MWKHSDGQQREIPALVEVTSFGTNPGSLRLLKYVPPGLSSAAPLVVALHGCTQTAIDFAQGSGWLTLAAAESFALLLPEQRPVNNRGRCFNWFEPDDTRRDRGEALSIRQMVAHTLDEHALDPRRVYITGLSAGGAMTTALLATYPEVFAGGAILAGLPYGGATGMIEALDRMARGRSRPAPEWGDRVRQASSHAGPWPRVSIWHGSADNTVNPANALELAKQWSDVHGIAGATAIEDRVDGYPRRVYRDGTGNAMVEVYDITGMPHGAPVVAAGAGPYMLAVGISAVHHIARFWELTDRPAPVAPVAPARQPLLRRLAGALAQAVGAIARKLPHP